MSLEFCIATTLINLLAIACGVTLNTVVLLFPDAPFKLKVTAATLIALNALLSWPIVLHNLLTIQGILS